ncbi:MAG TPA: O-antigen ligase family protein [Planctomycetota bacterium]|nr:O-antigen ligase family protein [Planctomycetota bacterium]
MRNDRLIAPAPGSNIPAILWLLILALAARVTVFIRQRGGAEFTAIDTSALVGISVVALSVVMLFVSGRLGQTWKRMAGASAGLLVGYYALCAVSALWSPLPEYSFFRSVETLSQLLAVFVALSYCSSFEQAERRVLLIAVLTMLLGMGVNVKFYGFSLSLADWHTNSYSASAAMIACYAVGEYMSGGRKLPGAVKWAGVAGVLGLALGTSSASTIAAFAGFALAAFLMKRWGMVFGGIAAALLVVALGLGGSFLTNIVFPGKTEGQIATLHGRTQLWAAYAEDVKESPLYGNGFGVSARLSSFRYTTNPHNSVFSVLLGTGAAGLLLAVAAMLRLTRETLHATRWTRPGAVGAAAAMGAGIVNSMGLPIIGDIWMAPTVVLASMLALHVLFVVTPQTDLAHDPAIGLCCAARS